MRGGTDDFFSPVYGQGYAYQVTRVDENFMYTIATVQTEDSFLNMVIKTDLRETDKKETIFLSSLENNTIH